MNKILLVAGELLVSYLPAALAQVFQPAPAKHKMAGGSICVKCGMDTRDPGDERWRFPCEG